LHLPTSHGIQKTLAGSGAEDKVASSFWHMSMGDDLATIDHLVASRPGGIHRFMATIWKRRWKATRRAVEQSGIPLLSR